MSLVEGRHTFSWQAYYQAHLEMGFLMPKIQH
jgi:hypothetical protein